MLQSKIVLMRGLGVTVCMLSVLVLFSGVVTVFADSPGKPFDALQQRLAKDGFDVAKLKILYGRSGVFFDTNTVARFFIHSESSLDYDQFAEGQLIGNAREYILKHKRTFENAQRQYGVGPEIITAILLVETKLGIYLGRSQIFNTLSTMAALTNPDPRAVLWKKTPPNRRLSREKFEKKADRRSAWAYEELKALIRYADREGFDPLSLKGSYAGAMGICQFMPSNIIAYARDGNADGKIDLFDHADAIVSAANYLKQYGWHPGIDEKKAFKVVRQYNHSDPYAKIILKIATLLED